jgi:heptosyltransferase-3
MTPAQGNESHNQQRPPLLSILRLMYWSFRRDWRSAPHLLSAVAGSLKNFIVISFRRRFRNETPFMALALTEHMGDIIAAEPVSRLARRTFPAARIHWIVQAPYRALVSSYPAIDGTVVVHCYTEWLLLWSYGAADIIWDLHLSGRECPICRAGSKKSGPAGELNFANYLDRGNLLEVQCASAGLTPLVEGPVLAGDRSTSRKIDDLKLPERFVVIHCLSNHPDKDWLKTKWLEVTEHLVKTSGVNIIEVGTISLLEDQAGPHVKSMCGTLSILETAEVIRRAKAFIGVDSGPAHIANAVGTPGVILFGIYWGFRDYIPYSGFYQTGGGATLLRADGLVATLPSAVVIRAIEQMLSSI